MATCPSTQPLGPVLPFSIAHAAQFGKAGGGLLGYSGARVGAVNAVLYNPFMTVGQRYTCLGASTIQRFYHNSALLLPSGDVLVTGGEQGAGVASCLWCGLALLRL